MLPEYFEFLNPVKMLCGSGALENIPYELDRLGVKKPLALVSRTLLEEGVIERIGGKLDAVIQSDIPKDSSFSLVDSVAKRAREEGCDGVLAIGGGSSIDTSKAIGIITNNEIIVSVCYHNTDLLPDFIEHTRRKGIEVRNKLDLILRLIYSSAVWFLKYLKQINLDISAAEKELERSIRNEDLLRLMRLQKTLVYFNTSIRGNEVMIGKLQSIFQDTDFLDKELVEDVIIELKQAFNTVNIYSDILTGTMDAFASIISNNVNAIMKRMTSLSITLMIPTLIASFYGMNVDIHLEEMPYAFALIILCSVVLSTLAFIVFRKIKWF